MHDIYIYDIFTYIWLIFCCVAYVTTWCHVVSLNFADSQGGHDLFAYVWVLNSKAESKSVVRLK